MRNAICILLVLAAIPCCARTITVDDDGPSDFTTIQAAIDDANDGDTVEIQPGRYMGLGNRDIKFKGKAITVTSTDPEDPNIVAQTIVDCNEAGRGFNFENYEDANSVLAGLTITKGVGDPAGIFCSDSGPLITHCVLTGNTGDSIINFRAPLGPWLGQQNPQIVKCDISSNSGTGIHSDDSMYITVIIADSTISNNSDHGLLDCSAAISNCRITGNGGAGIHSYGGTIQDSVISDNGDRGIAGERLDEISNCVVSNNGAGGIGTRFGSYTTIKDCIVMNNRGTSSCGIACYAVKDLTIDNCIVAGNACENGSGGIQIRDDRTNFVVKNCIVARNTGGWWGGGLYGEASGVVKNCTIADIAGNGIVCDRDAAVTITDSIVWGASIHVYDSNLTISYTDVQGGPSSAEVDADATLNWGPGNIDSDPLFIGEYRLLLGSPCIDAGDPAYAGDPGITDIDGEQRPHNGVVDMGADELIDTDGDGLPDWWEAKYFGSPTEAEPGGNPDNDSWPNDEEYSRSSDPQSSSDYYVDPVDGNDTWDGLASAWDGEHGPKKTIQAAVDACPVKGQVILLPGRYAGDGNRDIDPGGKTLIVRSVNPMDPGVVANTIIDSQGSASDPHRGFHLHTNEGRDIAVDSYFAIDGLTIVGGYADYGGGILAGPAQPMISRCNIIENYADTSGGGICISGHSAVISDCIAEHNTAMEDGGGLFLENDAEVTITNCQISANTADYGAGICGNSSTVSISNCVLAHNSGHGICGLPSSIDNSTVVYNSGYGLRYVETATNCIIRGNSDGQIYDRFYLPLTYSNVEGGYPGVGNIDADPCFVQVGYWDANETPEDADDDFWVDGDYHLKSQGGRWDVNEGRWTIDDVTSPCIDAGDPMDPIGHEPFPNGGIVNMGAYGGTSEASKSYFGQPPCETIVAGDINGDCQINFEDFRLMALHWCDDFSP